MDDCSMLRILKKDLQKKKDVDDDYLEFLLEAAKENMIDEGITIDPESLKFQNAQIHYAAYLYRNRAVQGGDTRYYANINSGNGKMPRFLRYELNQLVLKSER